MRPTTAILMLVLAGCDASPKMGGFGDPPGPTEQRGDVDAGAGAGGSIGGAAGAAGVPGIGGRTGAAGSGAGGALAGIGGSGSGGATGGSWQPTDLDVLPCQALGWNPTTFNACSSTRADGETEYRYTADGRLCGACLPARPAGTAGACLTSSAPIGYCVATSCSECPVVVIGENGAGPLPKCSAPANVTPCNSSALTSARQTCSTCTTPSLPAANQVGCLLSPIAVCSLTCQECWNL